MTTRGPERTPRPRRGAAPRSTRAAPKTTRGKPKTTAAGGTKQDRPEKAAGAAATTQAPPPAEAPPPPPAEAPPPGPRGRTSAETDSFLSGFAQTTSRVVHQAASILEEEIAAGVVAAKQVEERFVNVGELRSANPDEVIQRFRRDTHEIVDILLDLAHVATRSLGDLAGRAVRVRPATGRDAAESPGTLAPGNLTPTLKLPAPLEAGGSSEVVMNVENDSDSPTAEFSFYNTDLVNQDGHRIPANRVTFSTPTLTLGPRASEKVVISVSIPATAPSGTYSGLLQASRLDQLRAILVLEIG